MQSSWHHSAQDLSPCDDSDVRKSLFTWNGDRCFDAEAADDKKAAHRTQHEGRSRHEFFGEAWSRMIAVVPALSQWLRNIQVKAQTN